MQGERHVAALLNNFVGDTTPVIVLAKSRSRVHNAGTAVVGDVPIGHNHERVGTVFVVVEQRNVLLARKLFAQALADDLKLAALVLLAQLCLVYACDPATKLPPLLVQNNASMEIASFHQ